MLLLASGARRGERRLRVGRGVVGDGSVEDDIYVVVVYPLCLRCCDRIDNSWTITLNMIPFFFYAVYLQVVCHVVGSRWDG
jgi:hypothetical protein